MQNQEKMGGGNHQINRKRLKLPEFRVLKRRFFGFFTNRITICFNPSITCVCVYVHVYVTAAQLPSSCNERNSKAMNLALGSRQSEFSFLAVAERFLFETGG